MPSTFLGSHAVKAIIVAAGRGTRMGAATDQIPKCLVPFGGCPLIEWQLRALSAAGVQDVVLVTGYRSELLQPYGRTRIHNARWSETNMVFSLDCARAAFLYGGPVIVCYSDLVYEPRLIECVAGHDGDVATGVDRSWLALWYTRLDDPWADAESLRLASEDSIAEIGRRVSLGDRIDGRFVGLTKFTHEGARQFVDCYDNLRSGDPCLDGRAPERCYFTDMLHGLAARGDAVRAATFDHGWLEFDTGDDLRLFERMRKDGSLRKFITLDWNARP